jgi:hypothetical protein
VWGGRGEGGGERMQHMTVEFPLLLLLLLLHPVTVPLPPTDSR